MLGTLLLAMAMVQSRPQSTTPNSASKDPASSLAARCAAYHNKSNYLMQLRETILSDSLWEQPKLPGWEELACLRSLLAVAHVPLAKFEPGTAVDMPYGTSWSEGAAAIFVRLAREEVRPELLEPAIWATTLALKEARQPGWDMVDALASQVIAAIRMGDTRPVLEETCPTLLLAVSDSASARECLRLTGKNVVVLPTVHELKPSLEMLTQTHQLWDPTSARPMALATSGIHQQVDDPPRWYTSFSSVGGGYSQGIFDCVSAGYKPRLQGAGRLIVKATDHSIHNCLPPRPPIIQTVTMTAWDLLQQRWQQASAPPKTLSELTFGMADMRSAGFRYFAIPRGGISWSLSFRSTAPGVGGRYGIDKLVSRDSSELFLSDLILGSPTGGLRVPIGADTIWRLPWQFVQRGSELYLYFQIGSDRPRAEAVSSLRIAPDNGKGGSSQGVHLEFASPVTKGINGIQKGIGISKLGPGSYRLELTVKDPSTGRTASERTSLVIK